METMRTLNTESVNNRMKDIITTKMSFGVNCKGGGKTKTDVRKGVWIWLSRMKVNFKNIFKTGMVAHAFNPHLGSRGRSISDLNQGQIGLQSSRSGKQSGLYREVLS